MKSLSDYSGTRRATKPKVKAIPRPNISLSPETHAKVRALAEEYDMSMAAVVVALVDLHYANEGPKAQEG